MGSIARPAGRKIELPTIRLDTTLADLYNLSHNTNTTSSSRSTDNPKSKNTRRRRLAHVLCGVSSALALGPHFPRNAKFLYQDGAFAGVPWRDLGRARTGAGGGLRRELAMKYLALIAQRDAFICGRGGDSGDSVAVFFHAGSSSSTSSEKAHARREAEATLAVLDPSQRPELVFCPGPAHVASALGEKTSGVDAVTHKLALDGLEGVGAADSCPPLTVPLETQWLLNSKAALARSGLPTPRAEVVEASGYPAPAAAEDCCAACAATCAGEGDDDAGRMALIPPTCVGERGRWLHEQMQRVVSAIERREVPFVVKTQQTFGGAGTWVVSTEAQKRDLLRDFVTGPPPADEDKGSLADDKGEDGLLRRLLSQVTQANHHLHPASIILSDMVRDPVADYGLTFFVTEGPIHQPNTNNSDSAEDYYDDGSHCIFLGVSEQVTDARNAWIGSTIDYGAQAALRAKFAPLARRTAAWLAGRGYFGPAGADVLETRPPPAKGEGKEDGDYIVDLNVRPSGSIVLPLLHSHFTSRGLACASSFSVMVRGTRRAFVGRWADAFAAGRVCIVAWYEDPDGGGGAGERRSRSRSIADVVVGAEDMEALERVVGEMRGEAEEVAF